MNRPTFAAEIESNALMQIVIAGGSGFLGHALVRALSDDGHAVRVLTRHPRTPHDVRWDPTQPSGAWVEAVRDADAVINLAGESIAGRRWTRARKQTLRDSRISTTTALARVVIDAPRPPIVLSASGVGFYGTHGDEKLTEASPAGTDFLAQLCREWEGKAQAASAVTRVVLLRTGVVLDNAGGALPQLALPFKLFAGGPIGSGRQFVSWIHLADWVGLVSWALTNANVSGPLNMTAPNPVTNADLARALGHAMKRPSFIPAPAFAVRLAVGEMADAGILNGQRVVPAKAMELGYRFQYPEIEGALTQIVART